jgi:hypothetical protein
MTRRCVLTLALVCTGLCAAAAQLASGGADVRAVLVRDLRFTAADLSDFQRRVVRHSLPSTAPTELAVAGGVRIGVPKETFFARARDIVRFKNGPEVLQIGRFSSPPSIDDLAPLIVDQDDFDAASCRPGDCEVRLSAAMIARVAREIDRAAADAQTRGAAAFKQIVLEKVQAYVSGGADPMAQYDDGPKPIRPGDAFEGILAAMPEIAALLPALPDHLRSMRSAPLDGAEDFLYWSKEKFGIAPFITVTHVTIVCPAAATCVMATRDVYSSRYLDASVALAIGTDAGPGAFDLVYDNRSRANALKGAFAGLRRSLAERRARGGLEDSLTRIKNLLEKG